MREIWKKSAGILFFCLSASLAAGAPPNRSGEENPETGLIRLTDRTWAWIARDDRSSNGALFVGEEEALLVDPGLTPGIAREFLAAARAATDRPIRRVVLTHWHPDHAQGVACLGDRDFRVLAHPWTRRRLAERGARALAKFQDGASGGEEKEASKDCRFTLPEETITGREEIDLGSHRVQVFHPGPAHTQGDLVVWSPTERVLATGDLFLNNSCPSMGEGNTINWVKGLDDLFQLRPLHVVPGHFAPAAIKDLSRFRDYLAAQIDQVKGLTAAGVAPLDVGSRVVFPQFASFLQYPRYGATFGDNAVAVARELARQPARRGTRAGIRSLAVLDAGKNPHQIAFTPDGTAAFVAAAGSDRVTRLTVDPPRIAGAIETGGTPLGVAVLPGGDTLAVSRFGLDFLSLFEIGSDLPVGKLTTGKSPSLLVGPLPGKKYLVSAEQADRLVLFDGRAFSVEEEYPTGRRPFPPSATSDGRLAFVPNYGDGTVTIVDLWNQRVLETVQVGTHPSGGAVLPGDREYAVAVRGQDQIAFINTASHRVVDRLQEGIGSSPFSVVVSPDGMLAFVNNTASHDISVIELAERRVIARVPVGEIPIVMAAHPSGKTLWVSSEGSHQITVLSIPESLRSQADSSAAADEKEGTTEVVVLGMIHSGHRTSRAWGLEQVRNTIRRMHPDAVCAEIPPDRWERIWSDFTERGVIEDDRVIRFPEYTDVLLALSVEMGFEIIPCAGWTQEMSDLRQQRIHAFRDEPRWTAKRQEYDARLAEVQARYAESVDDIDDPQVLHSETYDRRIREELSLYDEYLNEWIGPGGWSHINEAHMRLIDRAIRTHRGRRLLITFGAGHKYWFQDRLRAREDVRLLPAGPFLPPASQSVDPQSQRTPEQRQFQAGE